MMPAVVGLLACANAASNSAVAGRRLVAHVDAVQKIPTKCGKIVTEIIANFQVAVPGMRPIFSRGDFFSWDFFSVASHNPALAGKIFINYRRDDSAVPILTTMQGSAE
jgi:hypothetical protein